ncbi:uncharacterized protein LOC122001636 [Zingiber officinale]|uniref:uncharacterized protein LOC122001636 n=1 Tax=Zingiber officinale TaxID=94328 RepID=UPI001C4B15FD|nr:uncharacterized protein LOC122001636 [Zingiber officinale]
MTPKEAISVTPFQLVYGGKVVVLVEVGVESDWVRLYDEGNEERRLMELDLVDETRDKTVVRLMAYRQWMRQNYNMRVIPRSFQVSDLVWKKIKPADNVTKLEAPWVGPYKVVQKLRSGDLLLEDKNERRLERWWSVNHLQSYKPG